MGTPKAPRSFLEELANYDDPAPKDFDPENETEKEKIDTDLNADEDGVDTEEAREHYVDVGKSKLRRPDGVDLGPQYSGASISRYAFKRDQVDNENEPFGSPSRGGESEGAESEEEKDEALEAFGSDGDDDDDEGHADDDDVIPDAFPSSLSASSDEGNEDQDEDDNDIEGNTSSPPPAQSDRAALRKMMAEEQKSVATSLSRAAQEDITKGKAIKQQQSTFDSLLNTRIKLQKALIATNSMAVASKLSTSDSVDAVTECASASRAAEEAALNLWNSLKSLRNSLYPDPNHRESPAPASTETSSQSLWDQISYLDAEARLRRRATLTKWSQRTNPITALRPHDRFSQAPAQQPLTSALDQQLSGESMERAVKRTRLARSCAPIQAASKTAVEDERIYDDADFYTLLLRELVDRRMADTQSTSATPAFDIANILPSRAELKVRKQVDTKASKGRKMRYTVQEKLQNFMAAEDRGSWGERQRAELFGSLLGRKVEMGEVDGNDEEMEDHDVNMEAGALKLFGR